MKHLKIVSAGWAGYTGYLGIVEFKDGVSVDPVPRNIADRLTGLVQFVEIDAEGNEETTGISHRLVQESAARVPVLENLDRQSEADRVQEDKLEAMRAEKPPVERFYTGQQLEEVASEKGMKGLRVIGDAWGVKHRSIPELIRLILQAQNEFLTKRNKRMQELSERAAAAQKEAEEEVRRKLAAEKAKQAEIDRAAGSLAGHPDLVDVYMAGDKVIPAAVIIQKAWEESRMTVTGWNALDDYKRGEFILAEIERLEAVHGVQLVAQTVKDAEPTADDEPAGEDPGPDSEGAEEKKDAKE